MSIVVKCLVLVIVVAIVGVLIVESNTSQQTNEDAQQLINFEGDQISLDLGQYNKSSSTTSQFVTLQFINQSTQKMIVSGWRTSCGCMGVAPEKAVVLAGDRFEVNVTISTKRGGNRSLWLQPILQQSNDPSIVHLNYKVEGTGLVRVIDSVVVLDESNKGVLRMICISPRLPSTELMISVSEGIEGLFSGWVEVKPTRESQDPSGRIWKSTVTIVGQVTKNSWVLIQTENRSVGIYPVM